MIELPDFAGHADALWNSLLDPGGLTGVVGLGLVGAQDAKRAPCGPGPQCCGISVAFGRGLLTEPAAPSLYQCPVQIRRAGSWFGTGGPRS